MKSTDTTGAAGSFYTAMIDRAVEAGVRAGMDYIETQNQKAKKERRDRRLHNTRLLLRNYRWLKRHAAGAISSSSQAKAAAAEKRSAAEILDDLDEYSYNDGLYIESIKKSQQRTAIILAHIDKMLEYYKIDCEHGGRSDEIRRYNIIRALYIDPEKKSANQVAEEENIERRTVYKDVTIAVGILTTLIFGIDGIKTT